MTLTQFESYGIAVSKILQTQHTYLMLVGTSAIADALPPTNADGSSDSAAQTTAVNSIVASGALAIRFCFHAFRGERAAIAASRSIW